MDFSMGGIVRLSELVTNSKVTISHFANRATNSAGYVVLCGRMAVLNVISCREKLFVGWLARFVGRTADFNFIDIINCSRRSGWYVMTTAV